MIQELTTQICSYIEEHPNAKAKDIYLDVLCSSENDISIREHLDLLIGDIKNNWDNPKYQHIFALELLIFLHLYGSGYKDENAPWYVRIG